MNGLAQNLTYSGASSEYPTDLTLVYRRETEISSFFFFSAEK